jgi:raffinose/stachyose/melibiose transport system permease protein
VTTSFLAFQGPVQPELGADQRAAIIVILPMLVLFLAMQRRFIAGMTAGALKG